MAKILTIIMIAVIIIVIIYNYAQMVFKISYYEQTLKNNKDCFSPERWENIEDVMSGKVGAFTK